jgi:hypothetical protein
MSTLTDKEYTDFAKNFLDKYLSLGFGVLSKKETESLIFSTLEKSSYFKNKDNYELSNELKITESKLKNLRLDAAMRFSTPNHKANLGNIVQRLIDKDAIISLNDKKMELLLENPVEKREFEYAVKKAGCSIDYARNREIVIVSPVVLLNIIISNAEFGEDHFKQLVKDYIKDTNEQDEILQDSRSMFDKISSFGKKIQPIAVNSIFLAAKVWLGGA